MTTIKIISPDREFPVKIRGEENNETILLLHGGHRVPDYLDEVAEFLGERYKAISYDQRGIGYSVATNETYSVDKYIADINAVVDSVTVEKFHLFGHSWGGILAQHYASHYPKRIESLFLCNPSLWVGSKWNSVPDEVNDIYRLKIIVKEKIRKGIDKFLTTIGASYIHNESNLIASPTQKIIPAIVLYGAADIYDGSERFTMERLPNAQKIELAGSGHYPWLEDTKNFRKVLSQFYEMKESI